MHNGKANWDGHSDEAANATVKWEVDFAGSPIETASATFQIQTGDHAVDVAKKMTEAWKANPENAAFPATRNGATVNFEATSHDHEIVIVGMNFTVLNKGLGSIRLSATGTEVEVIKGLFAHRSGNGSLEHSLA